MILLALTNKIGLDIDSTTKREFNADFDKLTQVLVNLISNAVKFSSGTVKISVSDINADTIRFSVQDCGPGIKPEHISKLFFKFQQLDDTYRSKGGTGLGLAISKAIIDEHKSTIGVNTVFGEGATFWFEIPVG